MSKRPPVVLGIRHGEVENPENVVYARMPGFGLSAEGKEMAASVAAVLAGAPVRAVYASSLQRAQETAAEIARPHGLEVRTDDRLIEWSFWTRWQGIPWPEVRDRSPETFAKYADDPASLHPEDPLDELGRRVLDWAAEASLEQNGNGGMVVGVSHMASLAAAYLVGRDEPIDRFAGVSVPHVQAVRLLPDPPEFLDAEALGRLS